MAIRFTGDTNTGVTADTDGDVWITRAGEYVTRTALTGLDAAFDFSTFSSVKYILEGSVVADGVAAGIKSFGANNEVYIRPTGTVFGAYGMDMNGDSQRVVNEGSVIGHAGSGIDIFTGANCFVENFGTVQGTISGVSVHGADGEIKNHGTVSGSSFGIRFDSPLADSRFDILNTGAVSGEIGISGAGDSALIHNTGLVIGTSGVAIDTEGGSQRIINAGTIEGDINLGGDDDSFEAGTGVLNGKLFGDMGNDTLILSHIHTGTIFEFDGGENALPTDPDSDTVDFSGHTWSIWVALTYAGIEAWTKDDNDFSSGNPWRMIADLDNVENIVGTVGVDFFSGNDDDNTFGYVGSQLIQGIEEMRGLGGTDTADFSRFESGIWVALDFSGNEVWTRDASSVLTGNPWREIADLSSIEHAVGTVGVDEFIGDFNHNVWGYLGTSDNRGVEMIDGRDGFDTADFSRIDFAVWINLSYRGSEVWTEDDEDATDAIGSFREIADLTSIEKIIGTKYSDAIHGDALDNVIDGGTGNELARDELAGSGGNDIFVFRGDWGTTRILDFDANDDEKIDLSGVDAITSFQDLIQNHVFEFNGIATISDDTSTGAGNSIRLFGYTAANFGIGNPLSEDDFIF